jgi:ketosteroid isomerase-like protein
VIVRTLLFLALLSSTTSLLADACPNYPAGNWKLDKASAMSFDQKWLDILDRKDTAALNCILADDFADTSRKGELRLREQVLRELPQRQGQYQQKLGDLDAQLYGDTAVVRGVNIISDRKGTEVLRIRFTDVLRFSDGRWLAVAAQETDVAR